MKLKTKEKKLQIFITKIWLQNDYNFSLFFFKNSWKHDGGDLTRAVRWFRWRSDCSGGWKKMDEEFP